MRVLITGNAGMIGSHLADRFVQDGHEVTGIDDLSTGQRGNVNPAVDFYEQSIRKLDVWSAITEPRDLDLIVHCAASYKDPDKWHRDTDTNILGTIDVTLLAKRSGCPIVYMQTALPPVSSYAISKTAGMQYIQQSGVPHLILRLANIYGPRNLSGPIPTFFRRITEGLPCTVVDTTRDMVYIDDLVECVMLALKDERRGIYDVCSGYKSSILNLYTFVNRELGGDHNAEVVPAGEEAETVVSLSDRIDGWHATTAPREGIAAAVAWYRDNPPATVYTHLRLEEPANV